QNLNVKSPYRTDKNKTINVYPNPYRDGDIRTLILPEMVFPVNLIILTSAGKMISKSDNLMANSDLDRKLTQNMAGTVAGAYVVILQDAKRHVFASKVIKR